MTQTKDAGPSSNTASLSPESVCVLIRTLDRPTLVRAVQSVLDQTYRNVHILVVAAHGEPLQHLPIDTPADRVRVFFGAAPLGRSAAANALLDYAAAELLLFLDDDDWLLPDHIDRLARALEQDPDAVAAYAGVRCVTGDPEAPSTVHVFDSEVHWSDMQWQNRLPIHSVLFRRQAVVRHPQLRFDEELLHFEDWDFWLRLMSRGPFVRVPGVSAIYWLDDQTGSGHAAVGSLTRGKMLARFGQRQLQRWSAEDVARLIEADAARSRQNNQIRQELEASTRQLGAQLGHVREQVTQLDHQRLEMMRQYHAAAERTAVLEQELHALRNQRDAYRDESELLARLRVEHLQKIEGLHARIAAIYASTSWRVTRPVRLVGRAVTWLRRGRLQTLARNTLLACRTEIRRKGWRGFLRRWPQYLRDLRRHVRTLSTNAAAPGINPFAAIARPTAPVRLHPEIAGTDDVIDASVSVVIPTLNGGQELQWLVRKLISQQAIREVEVVIVDSGSTDGTPERARAAGARVVEIPASEFSHSHARNLGAQHASGDYLLFMVQDAYPIGNLWLYGMLSYLRDHCSEGVVAASCAEYSRSDSDAMYDSMINTHYRFLGCLEADRIGRHVGDDHMSLRSMGQLSDVACLIPRELFMGYRYRGDYAEDLDLGMRLIKAGHRIAMLASVKVVHSHNRPAYYYLKRSFVDVIFLVGLFDDFHWPSCASLPGLMAGVRQVAVSLSSWLPRLDQRPDGEGLGVEITRWITEARRPLPDDAGVSIALGDARVDEFVNRLLTNPLAQPTRNPDHEAEAHRFLDSFIARLDHFNQFATEVYGGGDDRLRREIGDAVRKTFASTLGAALAYLWLDRQQRNAGDAERQWVAALHDELKAGV